MDCKSSRYLCHIAAIHMHLILKLKPLASLLGGVLLLSAAKATCYLCSRSPTATSNTYYIHKVTLCFLLSTVGLCSTS